jgi:hypothetical protein
MNIAWYYRWRFLAGLLVLGLIQRFAPWARADEPGWFHLNGWPEPSVGLNVDGSEETTRLNGVNSVYDTLFITPTIGLKTSGYVYHPNLLSFNFDGSFGWGLDQMTTTSPGYRQAINENDQLNQYLLQIDLLQEKPYNASFFASQDHTYRDYGSFDTFTVDSTRYGGRLSWDVGDFTLTSDFGYTDETDTGLIDSSEVKETYADFLGIHKRKYGQTTVTARWDMFDNILNFGNSLTSVNESVGIADSETFGSRKQITAATGVTFSHAEYGSQTIDTINATENVNINHGPNLDSFLIFDFDQNYLHPASESYVQGSYGIRHQLYESLTSTLDVHGSYQEDSDVTGSSTTDLYGVGLAENYVKRLQSWGHLSIGGSIVADHQDQSALGDTFTSIDESHTVYLPTSSQFRPVYLNRPNVITGSIQVTAAGQALIEGSDYQVISSGQLTEVRLIVPPSSHLQSLLGSNDSLAIAVTYQSEGLNNASFESLTSNFDIRLDLFGRFGIYGRLNWLDNDAPPQVLTQTLTDLVGGVDYNWRWLRTGAEYEDYDSNFSQYDALRFFQNLNFALDSRSSLGLNFNETFYHYAGSGDETLYQFTTRYNLQLWSSFSCFIQGGCSFQNVLGTEETDGAAEAGFSWTRGKLSVRAGYEYHTQNTTSGRFSEEFEKNLFFVYLKRTF